MVIIRTNLRETIRANYDHAPLELRIDIGEQRIYSLDEGPMQEYKPDKLLELCRIFLPGDISLADEVQFAITDPYGYLDAFDLAYGHNHPDPRIPWNAFFSGLMDRGYIAVIDWTAGKEEIIAAIDYLLRDEYRHLDLAKKYPIGECNDDLEQTLRTIGIWFSKKELTLGYIDLNADGYSLVLLDASEFTKCQKLMHQAGYAELRSCQDL